MSSKTGFWIYESKGNESEFNGYYIRDTGGIRAFVRKDLPEAERVSKIIEAAMNRELSPQSEAMVECFRETVDAMRNMFIKLEKGSSDLRRMVNYNEIDQVLAKASKMLGDV